MKKLLFIDDEINILNGLRRKMRHKRDDWDCQFIVDPYEAVSLIKTCAFDIIITDMRMPGLDGVEVLKVANSFQPAAIRILLSGQASDIDILNAANYAHQFLSKP